MKRLISFLLLFCLALSCAACAPEAPEVPIFYYLRTEETIRYGEADGFIAPVPREDAAGLPLEDLLQLYLEDSAVENYTSPIPKGTCLVSTILREDVLIIVLSREFNSLDGIRLTLAGACLAATCRELTGLDRIQVRSGDQVYDFDLKDFLFLDDSAGK